MGLRPNMILDLVLTQYLGLKPDALSPEKSKDSFVEMWVKKEDLKRPCNDGSIETSNCKMERVKIQQVIKDLGISQQDYPFTGLGYTYDWGKPSPVGASEFVIDASKAKPVRVKVSLVKSTQDYCDNKNLLDPEEKRREP